MRVPAIEESNLQQRFLLSEEQFVSTLRTGKTPDGRKYQLSLCHGMPTQNYTDVELKTLFSYLKSV